MEIDEDASAQDANKDEAITIIPSATEAPIMINAGLEDIEKLMESTGYTLPVKRFPISFDEPKNLGDLESKIYNRASGSVLESSKSTEGWIPWDLLLKQRLHKDIGVEKRFITFTMNFCTENGISPKSVSVGTHSSMGIPPKLMDKYVKEFTLRFYPQSSTESSVVEEVLEEGSVLEEVIGVSGSPAQPKILQPRAHPVLPLSIDSPPVEAQPSSRLSPKRTGPISVIPSFDQVSAHSQNRLATTSVNSEADKREPPMTRYNMYYIYLTL
jgi:hypothetical protein